MLTALCVLSVVASFALGWRLGYMRGEGDAMLVASVLRDHDAKGMTAEVRRVVDGISPDGSSILAVRGASGDVAFHICYACGQDALRSEDLRGHRCAQTLTEDNGAPS